MLWSELQAQPGWNWRFKLNWRLRRWQSQSRLFRRRLQRLDARGPQHWREDYALGTCNRSLILLRYAMNLAVRWEIPGMTANPTKDVPLFENPNMKEAIPDQGRSATAL